MAIEKKMVVGDVLGIMSFENQSYIIFHWICPLICEHVQSLAWDIVT